MDKTINELKSKLEEIINKKWIKGQNTGSSSAGFTLETLLGIPKNNFEIPDYNGIELKTRYGFFNKYITLFHSNPDSILFSIEYLKDNYGYPDKDFKDLKVFNLSFDGRNETHIKNWSFKIKINYNKKIVSLLIFDRYSAELDDNIFWSFEQLEEKLTRKLKYLTLVSASTKIVNKEKFIKYSDYKIYKLRSFANFLKLLEAGKIRITIKIGLFKSGKRLGQTHSHGVSFDIHNLAVNELFEEVDRFENQETKEKEHDCS